MWRTAVRLALAGLAALIVDHAGPAGARVKNVVEVIDTRAAGEPILAIVSLRSQRVTIYDSQGWILRAPVSSGQTGRETPAGIFSVIQKDADHYSNLYDDGHMPHMQRITWSGIALHGGSLPGRPASHGCVRMPFDFAAQLFDMTRLGMRVIVAPADVAPVAITHPALFRSKPDNAALAAARAAAAEAASRAAGQTRLAAMTASRDAARAMVPVRAAENLKARARTEVAAAEAALGAAQTDEVRTQAADAKAKADAKLAELDAQIAALTAAAQLKLDAVAPARDASVAAESARVAAAEAAREAARDLEPVSVFISRKTQRLYVRRAFQPVFDSPVTILDPDRPIGTHMFTAVDHGDGAAMRWNVVSLRPGRPAAVVASADRPGNERHDSAPASTDPGGAAVALDRVTIPPDILDRITAMVSPRSSLIISDEALSAETGSGTEFIVLLSGEPQGGIAMRHRAPPAEARYDRPTYRLPVWRPFGGPFSGW